MANDFDDSTFVNPFLNNSAPAPTGFQSPWTSGALDSPAYSKPLIGLSNSDLSSSAQPDTSQQGSSSGWNGVLDNPITHGLGAIWGYGKGVLSGVGNALTGNNMDNGTLADRIHDIPNQLMNPGHMLEQNWNALKNIPTAIMQGFTNPTQATQDFSQGVQRDANSISGDDPFSQAAGGLLKYGVGALNDPALYLPIGQALRGVKWASDVTGATPYIAKGIDAIASSPVIDNKVVNGARNAITNAFGNAFIKNYGATPGIDSILRSADGEKAFNQYNNLNALKDLQTSHGLTPDQLNEIGHVTEKTIPGAPEQQVLAKSLSDLLENGSANSGIGSKLMSQTASAVNGEPLLAAKIDNYFPHIYNNVPDELKGVFPRKADGVGGLSTSGTYNQPRTFSTLQDAMNQGLKPELNPFLATGQRMDEMSKAYVNNKIIQQIRNTPGMLFDKDPIDEVSKLVKTGRMDAAGAANQLGMSVDDLKKGFVQSQIPQLRGAYIRPADEKALTEYLNPSRPTGIFNAMNKATGLYNKAFIKLSPLPHMHNIYGNGMVLGEANPFYAKEAYNALKSGQPNPWYESAIKAGAINNPIEGKFMDAVSKQAPTSMLGKGFKAYHDVLWDTDKSIRTSLFREAKEAGKTDAEAAAHTNKYMVDYNNLTPFENKYMKPLIPFYNWKKGNFPLQASQMIEQTPKYVAWNHLKDAASQEMSGQSTDNKGRIMTGEKLPDGSQVAIDPYNPMDEIGKIAEKGVIPWAFNSMNPFLREGIAQGTSAAGAFYPQTGLQNKFPIYNASAPAEYNARKGLAHAATNLNPFSGSAIAGEFVNPRDTINQGFGVQPANKQETPGQTTSELITKLFGGFTGHDNPAKDAVNQQYQQRDDARNRNQYLKETGQPVSKAQKKEAYKKVPLPNGYGR